MNTNLTTTDMNIEDYEDQAIKKSKLAKGIGIAGAGALGGAAIAAGTTYAATTGDDDSVLDEPLDVTEMLQGAEVGEDIVPEPVVEAPAQPTTQYVYVEKPAHQPVEEKDPELIWKETNEYYIDGEKVASTEEGTFDGHDVMIADVDDDGRADFLAYDINDNHIYEENEIVRLTPQDNIHMGNDTAHTIEHHYDYGLDFLDERVPETPYAYQETPQSQHQIHNNFEDEKTGEEYYGDFAENNPDYNPRADMDFGNNDQYLAENYSYDGEDQNSYHAGLAQTEMENTVAEQPDLAAASDMSDDSFDSMMASEEFLG